MRKTRSGKGADAIRSKSAVCRQRPDRRTGPARRKATVKRARLVPISDYASEFDRGRPVATYPRFREASFTHWRDLDPVAIALQTETLDKGSRALLPIRTTGS